MTRTWMLLPVFALSACPKKAPPPAAPPVGWFHEEGWMGDCYAPKDFSAMGEGERRIEGGAAMTAIIGQWRGEREDGISFDEAAVTEAETQLMRFPDKLMGVLQTNLGLCKTAMSGGGSAAWAKYVRGLASSLSAGECNHPLDMEMVWYLDISYGWQFEAPVCAGEPVDIHATDADYYRLSPKGAWVNADGDKATSTAGNTQYPCSTEGCYAGALVLRFRGEDGSETVRPVGTHLVFKPAVHGSIEIMINDTTFDDNAFKVEKGVQHHTQVTYKPATP